VKVEREEIERGCESELGSDDKGRKRRGKGVEIHRRTFCNRFASTCCCTILAALEDSI